MCTLTTRLDEASAPSAAMAAATATTSLSKTRAPSFATSEESEDSVAQEAAASTGGYRKSRKGRMQMRKL